MDDAGRYAVYVGHARLWLSVAAGCAAGCLRLEGLAGFALYAVLCVAALTAAVRAAWPRQTGSVTEVAMHSVFSGLFTFALFWTLLFNLVGNE
jgi:hypothetical protein